MTPSDIKVYIACEFSGVVREAFRRRGFDARSCDLLPARDGSEWHVQGDVRPFLRNLPWASWVPDLLIAHPPCTYLCNSGVRWLYRNVKAPATRYKLATTGERDEIRWQHMRDAAGFFELFWRGHAIPRVAIENPIMHKHARELINCGEPTQIIQPWMFGHGETKATCLWLRGLPKLTPTNIVEGRVGRIHKLPPSKDRGLLRSITYPGVADAMAQQWGDYVLTELAKAA